MSVSTPANAGPPALQPLSLLPDGVTRVDACRLAVVPGRWRYADEHADAIDRLWLVRKAERPQLFNGRIVLISGAGIADGCLTAGFTETDFKSYLHWREAGFPATGLRDGFGSALIRSAEGHLLYGRQRTGHVNAGLMYPPGGFIDPRDIRSDGVIDIAASIAREVAEETGLAAADFVPGGGYWVTVSGPHVSIARELRSRLPAAELVARIARFLAADPDPELAETVVVRRPGDVEASAPEFARLLAAAVLTPDAGS